MPSENPAFENYFAEIYGERWLALRSALLHESRKVELKNPFPNLADYSLDAASLLPARHLAVVEGLKIADFCASPGGKSLATIFSIHGKAEWFCSDLSPARVARLRAVFHDCLPPEILARIRIARGDASRWGLKMKEEFDRILVDAPCSGERHLMARPQELSRWTLKGSKRLAMRQHALLCSALDCLKPGGRLVYSTCSISPLENDGVIAKLLRSRAGRFALVAIDEMVGEATASGWIVLPDRFGSGPIYMSVIEKN